MTHWSGCCCTEDPPDFDFEDLYVFVPCLGTVDHTQYDTTSGASTQVTPPCNASANGVDYSKYFGHFILVEENVLCAQIPNCAGIGDNASPVSTHVFLFTPHIKLGSGINVDGEFDPSSVEGQKACIPFCGRFVKVTDALDTGLPGCKADGVADSEVPEGWPVCEKCNRVKFQYYNADNLDETNANYKGGFSIIEEATTESAADNTCEGKGNSSAKRDCDPARPVDCDPAKPYIKLRCKRSINIGPNNSFTKNFEIFGQKRIEQNTGNKPATTFQQFNGVGNAPNGFHYLKHRTDIIFKLDIEYCVWLRKISHDFINPQEDESNPVVDTGPDTSAENFEPKLVFNNLSKTGTASGTASRDQTICDTINSGCSGASDADGQVNIPLISEWYTGLRDWEDLPGAGESGETDPAQIPQSRTSLNRVFRGGATPSTPRDNQLSGMYVGGICGIQIVDMSISEDSRISMERLMVIEITENIEEEVPLPGGGSQFKLRNEPALSIYRMKIDLQFNLDANLVPSGLRLGGQTGGCSGLIEGVQRVFGSAKLQKRFGLNWDAMDPWPTSMPEVSSTGPDGRPNDIYDRQNTFNYTTHELIFGDTQANRRRAASNQHRHSPNRPRSSDPNGEIGRRDQRFLNSWDRIEDTIADSNTEGPPWDGVASVYANHDPSKARPQDVDYISPAFRAKIPQDEAILNYTVNGFTPWEDFPDEPGIEISLSGSKLINRNKFSSTAEQNAYALSGDPNDLSQLERDIREEIFNAYKKYSRYYYGSEDTINALRISYLPFAGRRDRVTGTGDVDGGVQPDLGLIRITNNAADQAIRDVRFFASNEPFSEDCNTFTEAQNSNDAGTPYTDISWCDRLTTITLNPGCSVMSKRGEDFVSCNQIPQVDAMYADAIPGFIQQVSTAIEQAAGSGSTLIEGYQSGHQFCAEMKSLTGNAKKHFAIDESIAATAASKMDWTFDINFKGSYVAESAGDVGLTKPASCSTPVAVSNGLCIFPELDVDRFAYVNEVALWGLPCASGTNDAAFDGIGTNKKTRCFSFGLLLNSTQGNDDQNFWPECEFVRSDGSGGYVPVASGTSTYNNLICDDPGNPTDPRPLIPVSWPCVLKTYGSPRCSESEIDRLHNYYPANGTDPANPGGDIGIGAGDVGAGLPDVQFAAYPHSRPLEKGVMGFGVIPGRLGAIGGNPFERYSGMPFNSLDKADAESFLGEAVTHRLNFPPSSTPLDEYFNTPDLPQLGLSPTSRFAFDVSKKWWAQTNAAGLEVSGGWLPFSSDIPSADCGKTTTRNGTAMHAYEWNRVLCPQHKVQTGSPNPNDTTIGAGFFSDLCNEDATNLSECSDGTDGNCETGPVWSPGNTSGTRSYFRLLGFPSAYELPEGGGGLIWGGGEHRVNWYSTHQFLEVANEAVIPEAYRGWRAGLWDVVNNQHYAGDTICD